MPSGRPDRVILNGGHPLAAGLVFAGLGELPLSTYYHDSSFYHKNGTLTNMAVPATATSGWVWDNFLRRWVLAFDRAAVADYVDVSSLVFPTGTGPFTIFGWLKPTNLVGAEWLSTNTGANNGMAFYLSLTPNKMSFYNYNTFVETVTASSLTAGAWNAIGVVRTTVAQLFLGGVADGSSQTCTSNFGAPSGFLISTRWSDHALGILGSTTDILGWNRALSASDMVALADPSNVMLSGLLLPPRRRLFAAAVAGGVTIRWPWQQRRHRRMAGVS